MLFEFKIVGNEVFNMNTKEVIKDNKCKLYFDRKTYEGKELFITFISKNGYSRTVILGEWREALSCDIPPHILDYEYFKIFCYTKCSSKTKTIKVYNKLFLTNIDLLIQKIDRKVDSIKYEDGKLKCYSNNILIDTVPLVMDIDEQVISQAIDRRLSGFQEKIDEQLEDYLNEEDLDYLIVSL